MGKGTYLGGSTILIPGARAPSALDGGWISRPLKQGKNAATTQFCLPGTSEYEKWAALSKKSKRSRQNAAMSNAGLPPLPSNLKAQAQAFKEAIARGVLLRDGRPNPNYAAVASLDTPAQ
jgi:hypothetical protein